MEEILPWGGVETSDAVCDEVGERRFRRRSRTARTSGVFAPQRVASFSTGCLSPNQRTVIDAVENDKAEGAKLNHQRRARSFTFPSKERPALGTVRPSAHTTWTSPSCDLHPNDECRGRNLSRTSARPPAAARLRRRSCKENAIFDALVDGCVFADRYEMERIPFEAKPHCRLAVDVTTGQRVFLKFYPPSGREFQNAIRMHRALQTKACVSKLIDTLPNKDGYPPCLVFEAGAFSLEQRFERGRPSVVEQQALVHSILKSVSEMHAQGIVHGNLDPSHIMWFTTDLTWKLVNLDAASIIGDPVILEHITNRRYAAPEIRHAIEQRSKQTSLECKSDMWAVGLIAFELFTGATVRDSTGVQRYVTRLLKEWTKQRETICDEKTTERTSSKTQNEQRIRDFQFVAALLKNDPRDRATASQSIDKNDKPTFFPNDTHPTDTLKNFCKRAGMLERSDDSMEEWLMSHMACEHLDVSVSVERFASAKNSTVPFYARETQKMRHFFEEALPERPVYILPTGKSFRLRISIQSDSHFFDPIAKIASIHAQLPNSRANSLEIWQQKDGNRLTALALMDASTFHSADKHNAARPMFAVTDKKHVELTVRVRLRLADDFPVDICLCRSVYVHFKRPSMKLDFMKGLTKHKRGSIRR